MNLKRRPAWWAVVLVAACVPGATEENAVRRGDVAFARDSLEDALAEYRLAVRQGGDDPAVLARAAHTYVSLGRVEEATNFYANAARSDARWADIGVADLVRLARDAAARGEYFLMASAMEAARRLLPGVTVPDLTLLLARHYFQTGEYGRALPLYQRAEIESGGGSAEIAREIGEAQWGAGDCRSALTSFERFRGLAPASDQSAADWYIGTCSLQLARELRTRPQAESTDLEEALTLINRALEVGEPQAVQGQMWFEKGEVLSALGDCEGSLEAFSQVRFYESPASRLIVTAQQRVDQVRIGRDLVTLRGRCG
jgi:tetratricopeptide (TPR) repeat protein